MRVPVEVYVGIPLLEDFRHQDTFPGVPPGSFRPLGRLMACQNPEVPLLKEEKGKFVSHDPTVYQVDSAIDEDPPVLSVDFGQNKIVIHLDQDLRNADLPEHGDHPLDPESGIPRVDRQIPQMEKRRTA